MRSLETPRLGLGTEDFERRAPRDDPELGVKRFHLVEVVTFRGPYSSRGLHPR